MKIKSCVKYLLLSSVLITFNIFALNSPLGYWAIVSPAPNNTAIGFVKISQVNGVLVGEFVKFTPTNGSFARLCTSCSQYVSSKPLSGPVFMCNYRQDNRGGWSGGYIFDDKTDRTYNSSLQVSRDGRYLYVTGRSGPFSRTVIWRRVSENYIRNQ